ncbi:1-deoxy-D-xylulose-5-phosphate reductoisomerase [Campylobacter hepaticus]|uniref:1-deoxy-D-xylulose 5-phosphate reductoisomerase n=1 Tax=Campylobacter hepaticus TaxID=1813019 RepID=A0A424YYT3_9BACT|nr:1-deoxy-D-xylulose-5-phosphate reductoisomerase [Campylobacter hepaticus]AXP08224.1 1-deoxy-D-xylulose-5-phosphate reductoisomerase [Campylobacter hepaticus]MCZ0772042.1 1-deoxy-D-xylulose-5-phosphate reductoisomerase [Campylobacter hepaticus]MCZ0773511.1 1-deoxy-D-xylulose-5-phosphate reductoisomerase [Campylobacter hepaticus]MCZ0774761.1 1-deoxy-D-xylulose-5-phosphate reductoisomerase [Campylobacter hepaticus]MDX2322641.1 1-deoxy-D-xylulose-5-phosphate reductoisomerase [Campylobacter hepa
MILFGSTGSIGINALKLAALKNIRVSALACGDNIELLNEQIAQFKPEFVAIKDPKSKHLVKHDKVFSSQEGLERILEECEDEFLLNAIVGFAGLKSTLKAKELGKSIALANKESLVVAGKFLKGARFLPIDSEHAALKFLLEGKSNLAKLYITASGGAFYKKKIKDLNYVSVKDALKHPNWNMGRKITIDSATMSNKLFEIIEAYHLYGFKHIDALIEPRSLVHAMCEFKNGASTAYFSRADMRLAISEAMFEKSDMAILKAVDFTQMPALKFHKISVKKYPIFKLKNDLLQNPDLGVIINAANEIGVENFLENKGSFLDIAWGVFRALDHFGVPKISCIEEVFEYDFKTREYLRS